MVAPPAYSIWFRRGTGLRQSPLTVATTPENDLGSPEIEYNGTMQRRYYDNADLPPWCFLSIRCIILQDAT